MENMQKNIKVIWWIKITSGFLYCHRYITFGFDIFYV